MAIVHVGTLTLQVKDIGTRREFVERLIEEIEEHVREVATRCIEEALEVEVNRLLRRGWYERRRQKRKRRSRARCRQCGSQDPQHFRRDGHYTRYLDTSWGRLRISVPRSITWAIRSSPSVILMLSTTVSIAGNVLST